LFEELLNFRDFGGYRAGDRQVVRGRLFRSAAPSAATPADLAQLSELGVHTFIDLRRWSERQKAPSRRPDRFAGSVVEIVEEDAMRPPHEGFLGGEDLSFATLRGHMLDYYRRSPFSDRHVVIFRRGIEAVADCPGGVLIHCAVGKDRTGLLVSLIHHILGVSREDQMTDYLLSSRDRRMIDMLNADSQELARANGRDVTPAAAEAVTTVFADNLEASWAAMAERHGSVDGYLAAIGVSEATQAAMRERYLV
jgi:protein-tyrosine phosphatase